MIGMNRIKNPIIGLTFASLVLTGCSVKTNSSTSTTSSTSSASSGSAGDASLPVTADSLTTVLQNHDIPILQKFLKTNPSLANAKYVTGETALMKAVFWGDAEEVNALIAAGANVNAKTEFGETALDKAKFFHKADIIAILTQHGAISGKG